jgi:hypothetical protein
MLSIDNAIKLTAAVQRSLRIEDWDASTYLKKFAQRSPEEILKSKAINYTGNCLDLTFTSIAILRKHGYDPTLIVEERLHPRGGFPTIHFAMELTIDNKKYTIDFQSNRKLVYYLGSYAPTKTNPRLKVLNIKRLKTKTITMSMTPLQFIKVKKLERFLKKLKPKSNLDIKKVFEQIKKERTQKLVKRLQKVKPTVKRL